MTTEPGQSKLMSNLTQQRCHNHPAREAAGRCPACERAFCRECLTEHEDRVMCAACLRKETHESSFRKRRGSFVWLATHGFLGLLITWVFFYTMGRILLSLPTAFHDGTIWSVEQWDK